MAKKIVLEFDIDSKDVKIAGQDALSLTQQLRILKKELQKGDLGQKQFEILRKKIGDTEDQIAKTTVKSRGFFDVLSTLPGPVGQFSNSISGAIDTLKVFSSFSFKDIKNSLSDIIDDVKDIGKNFLGFNDTTDKTASSVDNLSDSLTNAAAEAGATGGALSGVNKNIQDLNANLVNSAVSTNDVTDALNNLKKQGFDVQIDTLEDMNGAITDQVISYTDLNGEIKLLSQNQVKAAAAGKQMTMTTEGLVVAEKQATFWTSTLGKTISGVLIATGIGIAIVLIGELVSFLYKLASSEEEAESATRSLTSALEEQQRVLQNDMDALDMASKAAVTRAKIAGKSEEEIYNTTKKFSEEKLKLLQDYDKQLFSDQDALNKNTKIKGEEREKLTKQINDKILKNGQDITKQILSIEQSRLDEELRIADKGRANIKSINDKKVQQNKEYLDKLKQDTKSGLDKLLQLEQENALALIDDLRQRESTNLLFQKQKEEDEIKRLKFQDTKINDIVITGEELRNRLLEQIRVKYGIKTIENSNKYNQEDLKVLDEFSQMKTDILTAAIDEEITRQKVERQNQYLRDLDKLEEDKSFIASSEQEKAKLRAALLKAYNLDINKINDEQIKKEKQERLEKLDDELRFLDIMAEASKNSFVAYWDVRQSILDKAKERELTATELSEEKKAAIEKKYAQLSKDLQKEKLDAYLSYITAGLSAVSNVFNQVGENNQMMMDQELQKVKGNAEEEDKIKKKYFEKNKNIQVAQAIIGTLQGAVQAYQSLAVIPVVGPALGAAAAAAALIFGYKKVALIKSTTYDSGDTEKGEGLPRQYADGGIIGGRRHAQGGTMIEAERGEAVMTRGAVTMFAPMLSMMNQMGGGVAFNSNLSTASSDMPKVTNPSQNEPVIMKTYVVENELTTIQQRQARLKDLSTL